MRTPKNCLTVQGVAPRLWEPVAAGSNPAALTIFFPAPASRGDPGESRR